ncbi:MAG: protein kinase [Steroidobacteraceae bacterium]
MQRINSSAFLVRVLWVQWLMNPGMRQVGVQPPDAADEGTIKWWLDALASGSCDAPAFLRAMQGRFSADPDGTFEVLSQLDQYYRRGRIEIETFKKIKTALAEMVLGIGSAPAAAETAVPVARDIIVPARAEQTDAHPRREEAQSSDSVGDPKPGSVLRRRYRIETMIGQGGTGTVFQALDEFRLEGPGSQRLAVKILHPAVAKRAELLAELRREFQSLQLLTHPNIIRVFDFDRDGPLLFFTMELLTGAPLGRILQARKLIPLDRPQGLAVIRDVGAALSYAHARGAVHGGLNPQNIFITGSGELRVMGFGASRKARQNSKAPDPEMTLPLSASTYSSCQVLEGEHADARDDVFSLACIAYLLLSGAHPFAKRTAIEAREAKFKPRRPANLSGGQWRALRSALHWESESRPADVQRWLSELELGGAVKKLAPLNDLVEPPAAKAPKPWLATGIATGIAALLFAVYWLVSHRDVLPSIDSTASIRAPASAPPAVTAPLVTAPLVAAPLVAAPLVATPPVAVAPFTAPPVSAPLNSPQTPLAALAAAVAPPATTTSRTASPVDAPAAAPAVKAPAGASKIELAADTLDVPAGQPSAQVTVHRKGNLRGETSFTWWTESGTAKPGADFSAVVPQPAYVADGKSSVSLSIPVSNAPHTQSKSFYVVIDQSEGGATLGTRTLTMVTLLPSD